jgi:hypothetical protein
VLGACPDAVECFVFEVSIGALFGLRLRNGYLPVSVWPTVEEAEAFLDEYEQARAEPFAAEERAAILAAAVYSRAYAARCTHTVGGDATRIELREYAEAFL